MPKQISLIFFNALQMEEKMRSYSFLFLHFLAYFMEVSVQADRRGRQVFKSLHASFNLFLPPIVPQFQ